MKLPRSKSSIFIKFLLCLFIITLVPFIGLVTVTRTHIEKIELNSARQYLSANLTTVSGSIDGILTNVEKFYVSLLVDRSFSRTLETLSPYDSRDNYQDFLDTNEIRDKLLQTAVTNNYIYSICAYSYPADRFFSSKVTWDSAFQHFSVSNPNWLSVYENAGSKARWIPTFSVEDGRPLLTSYRTFYENKELYGLISINIQASDISTQLKNVLPDADSYCFMTDEKLTVISASEPSDIASPICQTVLKQLPDQKDSDFFTVMINNEKMYVFSFVSGETGFRYFIVSPSSSINTVSPMLSELLKWYAVWLVFLINVLIALAALIFLRPIRQLFRGMRAVKEGNFDVRLPEEGSYEIHYINEHFNSMTENIQKLILENYEQQLSRKDAEIHNILNQLNEHFLYNTLDSIRWTARMEDAPQTSNMVYSLARFYRINLSSGKAFITIEQLIEMLESYLTLQKLRMNDSFSYTLTCDSRLSQRRILKYLFQPIIENSLVHGKDSLGSVLKLQIIFEITADDAFHFCVIDNGVGISAQRIEQIYKSLDDQSAYSAEHFALKMIHKQLQMEYRLDKALLIESEPGEYCKIEFFIPLSKLGESLYESENDYHR